MQKITDAQSFCLLQLSQIVSSLSKRNFPQSTREISEVKIEIDFLQKMADHLVSFEIEKKNK
jgi:predicted YcjX-like family ATPase